MPLFQLLEFCLVLRDQFRVRCFARCVSSSLPGITEFKQFDSDRVTINLEFELVLNSFGEHSAVPSLVKLEFHFKKHRDFGCDFGGLTRSLTISESCDAVLLEAVQVLKYGFTAAFEVVAKPIYRLAFGVEADNAGSEAYFWVDAWGLFEGCKLCVLRFG